MSEDSILNEELPFDLDEEGIGDAGIEVTMDDVMDIVESKTVEPKVKISKISEVEDILSVGVAEVVADEPEEEDEEYSSKKTSKKRTSKKTAKEVAKEEAKEETKPEDAPKECACETKAAFVPVPGTTGSVHLAGTYFVSRQYKLAKDVIEESEEEIATPVHVFVTQPAKVTVKLGGTINLQNYESLRIDFGIEMPCYKEDIVQVKNQIFEFIDQELEKEITNAKEAIAKKKAGISTF